MEGLPLMGVDKNGDYDLIKVARTKDECGAGIILQLCDEDRELIKALVRALNELSHVTPKT